MRRMTGSMKAINRTAPGVLRGVDGRLNDAAGGFRKATGASKGFGRALGRIGTVAKAAAAAVAIAVTAMAGKLAASTLAAAGFREGMEFSLTRFLGSSKQAKAALSDISKISKDLGLNFQESAQNFKDLVSAGFTADAAKQMIRFKADLIALGGGTKESAEKTGLAMEAIQKALASGRFEADGFNTVLAQTPVTKMQVLGALAKRTGKNVAELAKTDITKLPVKDLIAAFQDAALAATGTKKAGEVAAKRIAETTGGAIDLLKSRLRNLPDSIAESMGEIEGLGPAIRGVIEFMDSAEAKEIAGAIGTALVGVVKGFIAMRPMFKALIAGIKDGFKGAKPAIDAIWSAVQKLTGETDAIEALASASRAFGAVVGFVAGIVAAAVGVIVMAFQGLLVVKDAIFGAIEAVQEFGSSITSTLEEIDLSDVGSAMIDGLVASIVAGAGAVAAALGGVVTSAVDSAKAALGIESPSKVFEAIGVNTMRGFEEGIAAEGAMLPAAVAGQLDPGRLMSGVVNNNTVSVRAPVGPITIEDSRSPNETAEAMREVMLDGLGDAFEQAALQVGAS